MSFKKALKEAILKHLELEEGDWITDVEVTWDSGLIPDPTYGDSHSSPTFRVMVRTAYRNWMDVDVAFTFTELLKAVLVEDQK